MNMFKEHKYLVIRNAISFELANFAFNYFLMKRDATKWMHDNNHVSEFTPGFGTWKDKQVPNTYSVYGDKIHTLVGNNRMAVAREIGIKKVKAIITNFKADQFPLKGKVLKTDKEIKNFFHLPHRVEVRRDKNGEVDQINHPKFKGDIIDEYV